MKRIWEREMWIVLGFLAGCFALGMAGGILFANLAYPCRNGQNQILELYALTQIKKKEGKIKVKERKKKKGRKNKKKS